MAATTTHLTVADFERQYAHESGYEYWFGELRRKPMPTRLHGLLQAVLSHLLFLAGYQSETEVELRCDPDWHPRPDVIGELGLGDTPEPYPTRPVPVVFEVVSEGEEIEEKCRQYTRIGVTQVFVFDPVERTIQRWDKNALVLVEDVHLTNGVTITGQTIWSELARRREETRPVAPVI